MLGIPRSVIECLKKEYPEGTRVELISMNDKYRKLDKGERGTVITVDDIGTIHVAWDSGSTLGIVYGEDHCKKV